MYNYKARPPEETIRLIRSILDKNGIKTEVKQFRYNSYLYSCRVYITNGKLGQYNLGCNGKGITKEYALASGYAELMERIQNHVIGYEGQKYAVESFQRQQLFKKLPFQEQTGCPLKFLLFPDETIIIEKSQKVKELLTFIYPGAQNFKSPKTLCEKKFSVIYVKMYNLTSKKVSQMPIELMRYLSDSTGMCSGNNPTEAILQGICEICERYILQLIYLKKVRFPLYEANSLSDETKSLLMLLGNKGYDFRIINCSLGGKFPVIGLLVVKNTGENCLYSFRLGSDINPDVALKRCITEIFQGVNYEEEISLWEERKDFYPLYEYHKSLVNGSGIVSLDMFNLNQSSDMYFEDVDISSRKGTLLSVIEHFKNIGIDFWARDNSYLDFPAYYVYSPQLSPVSDYLRPQIPFIYFQSCTEAFFNINPKYHICDNLSKMEIEHLCSFLEMNIGKELMLHPYRIKGENNYYNAFLLLMALKMANGEYKDVFNMIETAHKYLYIDEQYYNTLKTALELAAKGCTEHIIRSYIKELDDLESVSDIIADLFEKKHALSNYKTFTLNNLFVEESVYFDWIKVQAKIANAFLTKKIDQSKIMNTILQSD